MNKRIVIPTDFSQTARNAVNYALDFLGKDKSEIFLLNAFESPHMGSGMLISINDILEKESKQALKIELKKLQIENKINGYSIETISEHGDLVGSLQKWSKKLKFDYVLLGTNGASGIKGALFGSNATQVIDCASVPVISVPGVARFNGIKKMVLAIDGKPYNNESIISEIEFLLKEFGSDLHLVFVETPRNRETIAQRKVFIHQLIDRLKKQGNVFFHQVSSESAIEGLTEFVLNQKDIDLVGMVPRKKSFINKFSRTKSFSIGSELPLWTYRDTE